MDETIMESTETEEEEIAVERSPDILDEDNDYDMAYKPSAKWDLKTGDFVRDGNGDIVKCDGYEAFRVWCVKVTLTQRNALRAYSQEIGTELDEALAWDDHGIVETEVQNAITEALLVNPRTVDVGEFEFTWYGEELHVRFVVTPLNRPPFIISL